MIRDQAWDGGWVRVEEVKVMETWGGGRGGGDGPKFPAALGHQNSDCSMTRRFC